MRKNPQESPGDDERFGGKDVSTVANIIDVINEAKARIAELEAELDEGRSFECEG